MLAEVVATNTTKSRAMPSRAVGETIMTSPRNAQIIDARRRAIAEAEELPQWYREIEDAWINTTYLGDRWETQWNEVTKETRHRRKAIRLSRGPIMDLEEFEKDMLRPWTDGKPPKP